MPIYEYLCVQCGARFEKLMRRTADSDLPAPPCPDCGSPSTKRLVSIFSRHGPPGADPQAIQAERAAAGRQASITPKEQIDKWRSQSKNKTRSTS